MYKNECYSVYRLIRSLNPTLCGTECEKKTAWKPFWHIHNIAMYDILKP